LLQQAIQLLFPFSDQQPVTWHYFTRLDTGHVHSNHIPVEKATLPKTKKERQKTGENFSQTVAKHDPARQVYVHA